MFSLRYEDFNPNTHTDTPTLTRPHTHTLDSVSKGPPQLFTATEGRRKSDPNPQGDRLCRVVKRKEVSTLVEERSAKNSPHTYPYPTLVGRCKTINVVGTTLRQIL